MTFLMSPHKLSIGLRSGDWAGHSTRLLNWNQDFACLLVCLGSLSCWNTNFRPFSLQCKAAWPLQGFWYMQTGPWSLVCATQAHITMLAPPCFTLFRVYCGLNSEFGGRLMNCLWPLDPKRTILLSSVHKLFLHFSLGQVMCSLANCIRCGYFAGTSC